MEEYQSQHIKNTSNSTNLSRHDNCVGSSLASSRRLTRGTHHSVLDVGTACPGPRIHSCHMTLCSSIASIQDFFRIHLQWPIVHTSCCCHSNGVLRRVVKEKSNIFYLLQSVEFKTIKDSTTSSKLH